MKILKIFLILICCAYGYSLDVQKIYQQAVVLVQNDRSDREEEEIFYEFYSNEIAKLSVETLKKNPELVLLRALAWEEVIGSESLDQMKHQLPLLLEDYKFILDHADETSKLYETALMHYTLFDAVLKASPKNLEEVFKAFEVPVENYLQKWAATHWGTNPKSTGKKLREEILLNVAMSPEKEVSFWNYAFQNLGIPELILGYEKPDELKIKGIVNDEEDKAKLQCVIKYHIQSQNSQIKYTITFQL